MTDRNTIFQVIESLFEDWILTNKNIHPLAVENMRLLEADALALLKEQEPKTGHWIDSAGDDKCSVCGATYSDLYPDYYRTHYCPNCGAKMIVQAVEYSDTSNEG